MIMYLKPKFLTLFHTKLMQNTKFIHNLKTFNPSGDDGKNITFHFYVWNTFTHHQLPKLHPLLLVVSDIHLRAYDASNITEETLYLGLAIYFLLEMH